MSSISEKIKKAERCYTFDLLGIYSLSDMRPVAGVRVSVSLCKYTTFNLQNQNNFSIQSAGPFLHRLNPV
jgi:hypothetical protein